MSSDNISSPISRDVDVPSSTTITDPSSGDPSQSPPQPPLAGVVPLSWPPDGKLSLEWIQHMMSLLDWSSRNLAPLAFPSVFPVPVFDALVLTASKILHKEPNCLQIEILDSDSTVVVVGDLHGQFHDLLFLLEDAGFPTQNRIFVFNGDYVDRGAWGLETFLLLLAWKVFMPHKVYLLRGNHESKYCTSVYGFEKEVLTKYGDRDPSMNPGLSPNKERGIGLLWGPDCTEEFLKKFNLKLIIRSHEGPDAREKRPGLARMDEGYTIDHDVESGKLVTLFSAPDYPQFQATDERYNNKGAYVVLRPPGFDSPEFHSFYAIAPRPKVNAYYDYEEVIDSDEDLDLASMVTAL
ncbi:hypothetical protein COLO4_22569 [Corchorus olitorius]|uniref:Serine/threonine-protein phosphatase n=1 Tax=Corchorus olitorius TaxID=93759 RepID=A0A1R3ILB1_9ROSI|nr:hypothetical protein COLO4_22569 [Corchorus olitorius]